MDEYKAGDITSMGLLVKCEDITTETVLLRNVDKRANLLTDFKRNNTDDNTMNEVEWGKETSTTAEMFKCNINMVLCKVSPRIPGISGAEAVTLDGKLYFPKTTLGEWVKEYLTTAHIKYKTTDKIVASEPSTYKMDRYFEYLPKKVHLQEAVIAQNF